MYLLSKITNDINIHQLYKNHCRYLSAAIMSAEKRYYNKLLLSSNNKPLTSWQIIKSVTNTEKYKDGILSIITDGINCNDTLTRATAFNTHFLTSPLKISTTYIDKSLTKPKNDGPSNYLNQVYNQPFQKIKLTPVTTKEIIEIVRLLKSTHSHGYDEIPVKVLKYSLPAIVSPLVYICNKFLSKGIFPTRLKFSQITPLQKKG